jgi:hypothetical protein
MAIRGLPLAGAPAELAAFGRAIGLSGFQQDL